MRAQRHPLPEFGNGTELSQIVEALRTENDALRTQLIAAEGRRAAGRTSIVPPPQQTSDEARAGAAASAGHAAPDASAETARDEDETTAGARGAAKALALLDELLPKQLLLLLELAVPRLPSDDFVGWLHGAVKELSLADYTELLDAQMAHDGAERFVRAAAARLSSTSRAALFCQGIEALSLEQQVGHLPSRRAEQRAPAPRRSG